MELPYTAIPPILPPLRPWSKNTSNRCEFDDIPAIWETCDVITFLVDLGTYHPPVSMILDRKEKKREHAFKTEYFKERFTLSRSIIKKILQPLIKAKTPSDVHLDRENRGRITIQNRSDISISLSYSGSFIALTVGKRKTGSDIEMVRPLDMRKNRSCSLFDNSEFSNDTDSTRCFLQQWTMVEAYSKLRDMNLYPLLKERFILTDVHFLSYLIDQNSVLALASDTHIPRNSLLWIDPKNGGLFNR